STAGTLGARVAGGAVMGGIDLLQQGFTKGVSNIDPTEALIAGGVGAAAPTPRKFITGEGLSMAPSSKSLGRTTSATDLTEQPSPPGHFQGETPDTTGGVEPSPAGGPEPARTMWLKDGEIPPDQAEALRGAPSASPMDNEGPTRYGPALDAQFPRAENIQGENLNSENFGGRGVDGQNENMAADSRAEAFKSPNLRKETPVDRLPFAEEAEPLEGGFDEITPRVERTLAPSEVAERR